MLNKTIITKKKKKKGRQAARQKRILIRRENTAECLREKQPRELLQDLRRALGQARGGGRKVWGEEGRESPCPAQGWSTYLCWGLGEGCWAPGTEEGLGLWLKMPLFQGRCVCVCACASGRAKPTSVVHPDTSQRSGVQGEFRISLSEAPQKMTWLVTSDTC